MIPRDYSATVVFVRPDGSEGCTIVPGATPEKAQENAERDARYYNDLPGYRIDRIELVGLCSRCTGRGTVIRKRGRGRGLPMPCPVCRGKNSTEQLKLV